MQFGLILLSNLAAKTRNFKLPRVLVDRARTCPETPDTGQAAKGDSLWMPDTLFPLIAWPGMASDSVRGTAYSGGPAQRLAAWVCGAA